MRIPDDETLTIDDDVRETLYRVVQESLNNAVRHGHPTRVEIEISGGAGGDILARVTDDGPASGKPEGVGYGLRGMRERVAAANGSLTINRGPDGGAWTVTARMASQPLGEELEARA